MKARRQTDRRSRPDAGFLMAETLITFALSALVLLGLVSSAAVLLRATDRSVATIGTADELGRTLAALGRDVSVLKRARWSGEEPQNFVFKGNPNSLSFAEEIPAADGGRELRVVSLREIVIEHGTALMRAEAHLSAAATGWESLHFGATRTVPTGVARLRFRYIAEARKDASAPRPVDTWPSGATLPAAIIVEAVDAVSTKLLVADRIALLTDGDIGCSDRTPPKREDGPVLPGMPGFPGASPQQQQAAAPPPSPVSPPGQPGTPAASTFEVTTDVANKNEFCGRNDKGVGPKTAGGQPGGPGAPASVAPPPGASNPGAPI